MALYTHLGEGNDTAILTWWDESHARQPAQGIRAEMSSNQDVLDLSVDLCEAFLRVQIDP